MITPAACGAFAPFLTVQHLTSSSPDVKKYIKSRALYPVLIILDSIDFDGTCTVDFLDSSNFSFLMLSYSKKISLSKSAEYGIISPGQFESIHYLMGINHLFFFLLKSSLDKFTKYTTFLAFFLKLN